MIYNKKPLQSLHKIGRLNRNIRIIIAFFTVRFKEAYHTFQYGIMMALIKISFSERVYTS